MSCRNFRNCGCCSHFYKSNSVTVSGNVLIINIPQDTFSNKEKACICLTQSIPTTATSAMTVAITIGTSTTQYPLIDACGNNVHADQLRARRVYHTRAITQPETFVLCNNRELCKTGFNFPNIPATAATSASAK